MPQTGEAISKVDSWLPRTREVGEKRKVIAEGYRVPLWGGGGKCSTIDDGRSMNLPKPFNCTL